MSEQKIEAFWENATAFDVAQVMEGETVEARFRDDEGGKWLESDHSLGGYDSTEEFCKWISSTGCPWRFCQVYREPSWFTDKPDPGPGYRLLEKLPDEELKPGDEYFDNPTGKWHLSGHAKIQKQQLAETWYRRRIEPVEPVESKPVLIRRRVVEIGDEIELPNGRVLVFNGEGFEVTQ
jgi:hypothetical protein